MPITFRVDPEARLVEVTVEGAFDLDDMTSCLDAVASHPDFRPGFRVLSDHSGIAEPATREQLVELMRHARTVPSLRAVRWAIVTRKAASYGMMRMMSVLAESVPMKVEVFADEAAARLWLDAPPGEETAQ